ncbi:MAG: PQQ-dependent sugar dehydrogenase [Gemmatimonadaceae bacterium]
MVRFRTVRLSAAATAIAAIGALVACDSSTVAPDPDPLAIDARDRNDGVPKNVKCDADNGGLTLPPGFCAVVVAKDVGLARHMALRPNGDLYVALNNSRTGDSRGAVLALRDTDGDGRADVRRRFGPTGGNGIVWHDGRLLFAPDDRVLRYTFSGNALLPNANPAVVVGKLPADGDHTSKTLVIDGQGWLYVNIGSASNSCQVANRQLQSPGVDPCPELPTRSGIWRFRADGTGQVPTLNARFATELRNMVALAINPHNGDLYGMQNGRDQLFQNWPNLFTALDDALLPAEELFAIGQGKAYGWPYCFYDPVQQKKVLAPEYGGDGSTIGRCASREDPIDDYPAHWAPLGMLFYTGSQFPAHYRNGLFIAFHGSRFDPTQQPAGPGYNVTFTPFAGRLPSGPFETFANGFAGGNPTPTGAAHRPVGLVQGLDGSLYISDDKGGWIWRVFYVGGS